ncbi:MAG: ATP-dependent zinc metalloprotease FtsH [Chloroflexi bacterium]|nr:ATP-dependent zinc metalloprotease FtsH [Chloroflexota bacterium]
MYFAPREIETVPISNVLNRAEHHEIVKATITGNTVVVTDADNRQFKAVKEAELPVAEVLRRGGAEVTVVDQQTGNSIAPMFALIPLIMIGGLVWFATRRGGISNQALSFGTSGARMTADHSTGVSFNDVAGVEEAKMELVEVVKFLKYPEKFKAVGARVPRGVLLVGPPGTGKTLIAKAVAGEANVPFFSISGSEFVEMFVGVGASRVRDLFRQAKKHSPCIIFIDEIDAVGRQRGVSFSGANEEREHTLNQLLVEMDGFDSNTNIVVIAATNRADTLDQALLRPGRFDRQVMVDPPDVGGRKAILEVHSRGKPLGPDVDLEILAQQTPGFSGADLANLINEAAILTARADKDLIGQIELEEAILRVIAGPERKSRVISAEQKNITAYHEVGHALVMKLLPHADPVHKVSIISRGQALGLTVQRPKDDRYLVTKAQLLARMAGAMGGRAAEELIFGDITTGARQDIEYVTDIARKMVCEFGMSELGAISLRRKNEHGARETHGDTLATRIDHAIIGLVEQAYQTAHSILVAEKDKLIEIAEHLKKVETIDAPMLDKLLQGTAKKQGAAARSIGGLLALAFGRRSAPQLQHSQAKPAGAHPTSRHPGHGIFHRVRRRAS